MPDAADAGGVSGRRDRPAGRSATVRAAVRLPVPVTGGGFGGGGIGGGSGGTAAGHCCRQARSGRPMAAPSDFAKAADAGDGRDARRQPRRDGRDDRSKDALDKLKDEKDPKAQRRSCMEDVKKLAEQKQRHGTTRTRRLKGGKDGYQTGKLGVDLAEASNNLRNQDRVCQTANRQVQGRNCLEVGGVWIDDAFKADTKSVTVKAQSDAYFRILEKHPEMKDVFRLGNSWCGSPRAAPPW